MNITQRQLPVREQPVYILSWLAILKSVTFTVSDVDITCYEHSKVSGAQVVHRTDALEVYTHATGTSEYFNKY